MFLVNRNGSVVEIKSFSECPNGDYVFTHKEQADEFAEQILDKKIQAHEKFLNQLKAKKAK